MNSIEQNPIEQNPIEQNPIEQNPIEQNPIEQNPIEQNPIEQNPIKQTKNHVTMRTIGNIPFTLLLTHPLLEGAGFKCIDFDNDEIPINANDFANLVYYRDYNDRVKVYDLLKIILPYSVAKIQYHFIKVLKKNFSTEFCDYVDREDINIVDYVEQTNSFKEFVEKIMQKYNRHYQEHRNEIREFLENKEYHNLYNYGFFNVNFLDEIKYLNIQQEIFSDTLLSKYIIDNLVNLNVGWMILNLILNYSTAEVLEHLIKKGVPIQTIPGIVLKSLHIACQNENYDMFKLLVENGADIETCLGASLDLLFYACSYSSLKIVKYLVKKYTNIHTLDERSRNILHVACGSSTLEIIKYLIKKGVNMFAVDFWGKYPIDYAKRKRRDEIVEYVRKCMDEANVTV